MRKVRFRFPGVCLTALMISAAQARGEAPDFSAWLRAGDRYAERGLDHGAALSTGDYLTSLEGEISLKRRDEKGVRWRLRYHPYLAGYTRDLQQREFDHFLDGSGTWIVSPRTSFSAGDRFYRVDQQIGLVDPTTQDTAGVLLKTTTQTSNTLSLSSSLRSTERSRLTVGSRYLVTRLSDETLTDVDTYSGSFDWDFQKSLRTDFGLGYEYARLNFSTTTPADTQQLDAGWSWSVTPNQKWSLSAGASQVDQDRTRTTEPIGEWEVEYAPAEGRVYWMARVSHSVRGLVGVAGPVSDTRGTTSFRAQCSDRLRCGFDLTYGRTDPILDTALGLVHHRRATLRLDYAWTPRFFGTFAVTRHDQRSPEVLFSGRRVNYYYVGLGYQLWPRQGNPAGVPEGDFIR